MKVYKIIVKDDEGESEKAIKLFEEISNTSL